MLRRDAHLLDAYYTVIAIMQSVSLLIRFPQDRRTSAYRKRAEVNLFSQFSFHVKNLLLYSEKKLKNWSFVKLHLQNIFGSLKCLLLRATTTFS